MRLVLMTIAAILLLGSIARAGNEDYVPQNVEVYCEFLNHLQEHGYLQDYSPGYFKTLESLSNREIRVAISNVLLEDTVNNDEKTQLIIDNFVLMFSTLFYGMYGSMFGTFPETRDVPLSHWAYNETNEFQLNGYLPTFPAHFFNGDITRTNYDFAVAAYRIHYNLPEETDVLIRNHATALFTEFYSENEGEFLGYCHICGLSRADSVPNHPELGICHNIGCMHETDVSEKAYMYLQDLQTAGYLANYPDDVFSGKYILMQYEVWLAVMQMREDNPELRYGLEASIMQGLITEYSHSGGQDSWLLPR